MRRLGFESSINRRKGCSTGYASLLGTSRFGVFPGGAVGEHAPATPARSSLTLDQVLDVAKAAIGDTSGLGLVTVAGSPASGGPGSQKAETYNTSPSTASK